MEVASYPDVSQFEPGKSPLKCGYYACALNAAAGRPGQLPTHPPSWVQQNADSWYEEITGIPDTPSNPDGMFPLQLYFCLKQKAGLNYVPFNPALEWVKAFVEKGYPVIILIPESSVFDLQLHANPYAWSPVYDHYITVSGITADGNLLCHDPASISSNGVRPGPREYDASRIILKGSTAVVLPWLPVPVAGFDPTKPIVSNTLSHTIQPGETLSGIASSYHVAMATILAANQKELDAEARRYGYQSSQNGNVIFPGTILHW